MMREPGQEGESKHSVALLDTSVQIDRKKSAHRAGVLNRALEQFDWTVATSISVLEFKATVIRQCITIHAELAGKGRFTVVRDALQEKKHPQSRLRAHIFNNLIQVFASSFEVTEDEDRRLAEKARLALEGQIPRLYKWFTTESVGSVLSGDIQCSRAKEPPVKKRKAFDTNLPECRRGKNKWCNVEGFIRDVALSYRSQISELMAESDQLKKTLQVFDKVASDDACDLSHSDCRNAGDCLIAMEARKHATHAVSTNAREWAVLSRIFGYEFVHIEYPAEQTGRA